MFLTAAIKDSVITHLELDNELLKYDLCNIEYQHFLNIFLDILKKHAPFKKKCMTRELSKAIMKRSKLRKRFLKEKEKGEVSRRAYTTQRNYCVNLMRKTKREYFANIKINNIADNKKLWQTIKPLFSDEVNHRETINLIDNELYLMTKKLQKHSINIFVTLLKTYHYQKIFLFKNRQLNFLLTLLYLLRKNIKIIQA